MITGTQYQISLHKAYDKILYIYPALEETFAFLAHRESGKDIFVHCDVYGKNLFQYAFEEPIDTLQLIEKDQAILLNTRKNAIIHINLHNYLFTDIPFQFMLQSTQQSRIECFSDWKLMCVLEHGFYNDHRLKLSYFKLPLLANKRPIEVYLSKDNQWTFQHEIRRINNRSSIAWFKARHDDYFQIKIYELDSQMKGAFRIIKSDRSLASFYGMNQCDCALLELWQMPGDRLFLVTLNSRSDLVKTSEKINTNSNYVLDMKSGSFRESRFILPKPYNQLSIDHCYLGYYSIIRTFAFENSRAKQTPVYYINNFTEELIEEESWQCSYLYKFTIPGYDGTMLFEAQHENEDVHMLKVTSKKPIQPGMLALHLLLIINEDFDHNLLQEIISFLPSPQHQI